MRAFALFVALAGCSTVQSLQAKPPFFEQATAKSLASLQGCIAAKTANQNVQFLPREGGAAFSAGVITGAARYVTWAVNVDDTGRSRRVTVYSTHANSKLILPAVTSCV